MPLGEKFSMVMAGQYCGVPVSISMAYLQIADDFVGEDPGTRLVRLWFDELEVNGGPWKTIRGSLSQMLNWECVSVTYGATTETLFLTDAAGLIGFASLPTAVAVQINIAPLFPHPGKGEGRFYLPGFINENQSRGFLDTTTRDRILLFCQNIGEIDDLGAGQGPRWKLIPHADYVNEVGGDDGIDAFAAYPSPFLKVIGSRRSDACQAFSGSGGAGFESIIVSPDPV